MIATTFESGKTYANITALTNWEKNPRNITPNDLSRLKDQLTELGQYKPLLVTHEGVVIGGNMRLRAMRELGITNIWVAIVNPETEQKLVKIALSDNDRAGYYLEDKLEELVELYEIDKTLFAIDVLPPETLGELFETKKMTKEEGKNALRERFLVPPFSILDARLGYWQERKEAWISQGLLSEKGRNDLLTFSDSSQPSSVYDEKKKYDEKMGKVSTWEEFVAANPHVKLMGGTSIFDPVLCEIVYSWFGFPGAKILDPFAGGSVRGIVCEKLGLQYTGIDLSETQVLENREQAKTMEVAPNWIVGNSLDVETLAPGEYDGIFSCPPYFDLEEYSKDPKDLSNKDSYDEFHAEYKAIIYRCLKFLKENRFAVFVVGDIRDKKGFYHNFVSDTIEAFEQGGAILYNEAILATQFGSLPIRVGKQFANSRKLGKTHQNVLVFYKGDPKQITTIYPQEIRVLEEEATGPNR